MNRKYPWYDSVWLNCYTKAKTIIQTYQKDQLEWFVETFLPLRTRKDFDVVHLSKAFNESKIEACREIIKTLTRESTELHELLSFGRMVVHNNPYFNQLQLEFTDTMSEIAKEEVVPEYNFLSLYNNFGICNVHMDAPNAKWTLDVCIEQSAPWPIAFSQVQDWPENFDYQQNDWHKRILENPENNFKSYELKEGEAIVFSGSSQWHYRDRMPQLKSNNYCHLVFFHYIPKSMQPIIDPASWADYFGIPELKEVAVTIKRQDFSLF